jgi:uncharacterized glyoxalase superfamily protein PhnB
MKPTPPGWPRISSSIFYENANEAIAWLCKAFGFEVRLKVEGDGGRIEHSELVFGDGLIMVGDERPEKMPNHKPPTKVGGVNTQSLFAYVDDIEAHFKRAKEAGAKITTEPKNTDYGEEYWEDRSYGCEDIGGHHWWFAQRMRSPAPKK